MRWRAFGAACAALLIANAPLRADAIADFYKGRTVKFLIGGSVGGGYDLVGRLVASRIGAHIPGNPNVVAENLPSAGGLIMANTFYNREARDGSVLGMPTNAVALEPRTKALSRESGGVRFEADKFGWLGAAARQPQAMFMMADAPVKTAADIRTKKSLIAALLGSDSFILPTLLNATAGARMEIIPGYRSLADSLIAMERGEVHGHSAGLANILSAKPEWLRDGRIRVVLQFGAERLAEFADVPTAVEMASDELDKEMLRFYALKYEMAYAAITPPGVPDERVAALKRAFDATMRDPVYVATARKLNLPLNFVSSAEVQDIMARVMNTPEPPARRFRDIMEAVTRH